MIFFQDTRISSIHANWVGNKLREEGTSFRDEPTLLGGMYSPDDKRHIDHLLLRMIARCFTKYENSFAFREVNQALNLNDVYNTTYRFFHEMLPLKATVDELTALLYSVSEHPKINAGILLAVHLKDVQFEGEQHEALAVFKLSSKIEGLDFRGKGDKYDIWPVGGIFSVDLIDIGAIIMKTAQDSGYRILVHSLKNTIETSIWKDDYLQVKIVEDESLHTSMFMKVYKNFVMEKLEDSHEMDSLDQYELLNKAVEYVTENETLDLEEFNASVIKDAEVSSLFKNYLSDVQEQWEIKIPEHFVLSSPAVKKAKATYKKVIKLDRNFHLYVHGNRDLVEQGFDESKGMNFYKVYYDKES